MLNPAGSRPAPAPAKVEVTVNATGNTIKGTLVSRDEFTITMKDEEATRTFQMSDVKVTIDDPMAAHFEQLGKYSDDDMHNVYAYLRTLQ
jgi:cytochrome c oxidase cbb3-type subunit 3